MNNLFFKPIIKYLFNKTQNDEKQNNDNIDIMKLKNFKFKNNLIGSQDIEYYNVVNDKSIISEKLIKPKYHYVNINKNQMPKSTFIETLELKNVKDKYSNIYKIEKNISENIAENIAENVVKKEEQFNKYIYKNLRFENEKNIDKIEHIILYIGGVKFDKFYGDFYKQLQNLYEMKNIPFYIFKNGLISQQYHEFEIDITFKNKETHDVKILVDKYKNCELSNRLYKFSTYQNYNFYIQPNKCDNKIYDNKFTVINHPVYLFISNKKIKNIKLIININVDSEPEEFNLKQDENLIIHLTDNKDLNYFSNYFLNFSKIHSYKLKFDCDNYNNLKIIAINSHPVRMMNGMIGLMYSK